MIHRYSAVMFRDGQTDYVNLDSICILKRGEEIRDGKAIYIICCQTATYTMEEYKAMREKHHNAE